MKYLMTYESVTNYKVEILTGSKFSKLYHKLYPYDYDSDTPFDLSKKIHYFNWNDVNSYGGSQKHSDTSRFVTAYNNKDILGICFFSWWDSGDHTNLSNTSIFHLFWGG